MIHEGPWRSEYYQQSLWGILQITQQIFTLLSLFFPALPFQPFLPNTVLHCIKEQVFLPGSPCKEQMICIVLKTQYRSFQIHPLSVHSVTFHRKVKAADVSLLLMKCSVSPYQLGNWSTRVVNYGLINTDVVLMMLKLSSSSVMI